MPELNSNDMQEVALTPVEQAAIVLLSIGEEPAAAVLRSSAKN
jgi:flagellar motor switch protein FliG